MSRRSRPRSIILSTAENASSVERHQTREIPISAGIIEGPCGIECGTRIEAKTSAPHGADPAVPQVTGPPAAASTRHFALPVTVTVPNPLFVTCAV